MKKFKLFKVYKRNKGNGKPIFKEENLSDINFNVFKFNNRLKPEDKRKILFITCFSEFGCESISLLHCIPKILNNYLGYYVICVGWYGREYLYRHLVDEYWEIDEKFQWLREYPYAFDHCSKNLNKLEQILSSEGNVYKGSSMARICLGNNCINCNYFWASDKKNPCPKCNSNIINRSLFSDIKAAKNNMLKIPTPSKSIMDYVKKYLKPNSVGIFARNRVVYGRNFDAEFYKKLIKFLEIKGYNPIWLGEKQSVLPCPVDHIVDFSSNPESRDLEKTLAIISQLKFTIQLWTASTRLSSMMNTPWILFESPDQILGCGQEGKRIALTTDFNKKKLILSHYNNVLKQPDKALDLIERAINEMNDDNWDDILGLIDQPEFTSKLLKQLSFWN